LCLAQSVHYLDYALHQRPRYITFWHQTNWLHSFEGALDRFKALSSNESYFLKPYTIANFEEKSEPFVDPAAYHLWIALRIHSYGQVIYEKYQPKASSEKRIPNSNWAGAISTFLTSLLNEEDFKPIVEVYKAIRASYAKQA